MKSIQRSVRSALGGLGATSPSAVVAVSPGRTVTVASNLLPGYPAPTTALSPWGTTDRPSGGPYTSPVAPGGELTRFPGGGGRYTAPSQSRDVITRGYTPVNYPGTPPDQLPPGTPPAVVIPSTVWPSPNSCTSPCGPTECRGLPWQWWAGMHNGR